MQNRQGHWRTLGAVAASLLLLAAAPAPIAAPAAAGLPLVHVLATVTQLRSAKGRVLACLTRDPAKFPDCDKDPAAYRLIVPAAHTVELDFGPLPQGHYALALIHDENGNGKLDKLLMVPREGFGFSRDAPVRMGPPAFDKAVFNTSDQVTRITLRMRYLL